MSAIRRPTPAPKRLKLPTAFVGSLVLHVGLVLGALSVSAGMSHERPAHAASASMQVIEQEPLVDVEPADEPEPPEIVEKTTPPPTTPRVLGAPVAPISDVPPSPAEAEPNDSEPSETETEDSPYDDLGGGPVVAIEGDSGQGSSFSVRSGTGTGRGIGAPVKRKAPKPKPKVYAVSGVDTPPVALISTQPAYPRSAQRRRIEGWARVSLLIDATGRVAQARVLATKGHSAFGQAVLASISTWRFRPATVGGQPVSVWASRTVNFKMPKRR